MTPSGRASATRARVASLSEDLAAVGGGRDPRRPVDVEADDVAAGRPRPRRCGGPSGPGRRRRPATARRRGRAAPSTAAATARSADGEDDEERVALGALLDAVVGREGGPQQRPVALPDVAVRPGPELDLEAGRALDVGEQEGDGARSVDLRQRSPRTSGDGSVVVGLGQVAQPPGQAAQDREGDRRAARRRPPRSPRWTRARQVVGSTATTWAFRGLPSRTDSSPKKSPGTEGRDLSARRG